MTVHQAKGLGFDMVILPQLEHRNKMNMIRADWTDKDILWGGKSFEPCWILKSPKISIAEKDPVLGDRLRKIDEDHCFDWLCLLYVAMTRARNALYMITSPGKQKEAFRPASLLKHQLAGTTDPEAAANITINKKACSELYSPESGNRNWYESFPMIPDSAKAGGPGRHRSADFCNRASRRKALDRSEPSREDVFEREAAELFNPETRDVLDFGSAIHELFEKIGWLDKETNTEEIIEQWIPSRAFEQKVQDDVISQFRNSLESEEVRAALARPEGNTELWREKSFEIILDERWISGVFDRVVITRDEAGNPTGAAILDFKSDRNIDTKVGMRNKAEHYRPQMELYRRALAGILSLAEDRISTELVFTGPGWVFQQ